jgi:hypothetical protein
MGMLYDANNAPDPQEWLELDEQERIDVVIEYHRHYHLLMGESAELHGVAHVIIENQIALGDPAAVSATLARLMGDGLDRHDAVHAVGSVVMGIVFDMTRTKGKGASDANARYGRELAELTVASWRTLAN